MALPNLECRECGETKPADHFDVIRSRPPKDPTDATFSFEVTVDMPVCRKCTGLSETMADEGE